jgi:hypothetical protein
MHLITMQRSDGVFLLETDWLSEGLWHALVQAILNCYLKKQWYNLATNCPL